MSITTEYFQILILKSNKILKKSEKIKKVLHYGYNYHIIPMLMSRRSARLLKHRKALS